MASVAVIGLAVMVVLASFRMTPSDMLITEVVTSNASTVSDQDGDHSDWIELHNPHDQPIDVGGYRLVTSAGESWRLPSRVVEPGGFLLVFASGKDRVPPQGEWHTDFRLSRDGVTIGLVSADGRSQVDTLEVPALPRNASYVRDPQRLSRTCLFAFTSPGQPNPPECFDDARLGAPDFSVASGHYADAFVLSIESLLRDATIIYTLDGSYPDLEGNPTATLRYDGPITITDRSDQPNVLSGVTTTILPGSLPWQVATSPRVTGPVPKITTVRARSLHSATTSAVYFVGLDRDEQSLPVVSVAIDPGCLFDVDDGIYVPGRVFREFQSSHEGAVEPSRRWQTPANYLQRGRDWECPERDRPIASAAIALLRPHWRLR
ncbi:MAG: lamin tail domain-containing protein [Nitriliruptoraceae bacterium]